MLKVSDELSSPVLGQSNILLVDHDGVSVVDIRAGGCACHGELRVNRWVGVKHWRDLVRVFVDRALHV